MCRRELIFCDILQVVVLRVVRFISNIYYLLHIYYYIPGSHFFNITYIALFFFWLKIIENIALFFVILRIAISDNSCIGSGLWLIINSVSLRMGRKIGLSMWNSLSNI